MEIDFQKIDKKWQSYWKENKTNEVEIDHSKEKFYVLDMFPYPSGEGLHVGHPLGYIASDIIARYKKHKGFNVLHPMGYDSFGLPAEQYAIQTGQHPALTTEKNIARYREQLDRIGFAFDWSREVRTSDPGYYRWTQWIFKQIFNSWYNLDKDRAESVDTLIKKFEENGTYNVNASIDTNWHKEFDKTGFPFGDYFVGEFTATDWQSLSEEQKENILLNYRLAFLSATWVNWCPQLGTVLANDEVKEGVSERGGYPVERKLMRQWSLRITAYAERLLEGLNTIDWSESIKEVQRNWIGKSQGAQIVFDIEKHSEKIEVFTTRPDTIFGVSFMVLAPEHELIEKISTQNQIAAVKEYVNTAKNRSERDRQADVKNVTGVFTGAFAIHPFTGKKIPIWIADYVLAGYGSGAVMAVPCGDQRDYNFAKEFNIPIPALFEGIDISENADPTKEAILINSDFLNGLTGHQAIEKSIVEIQKKGIGFGRINYRLRDAIFSRQRYWGEPFPVYFENGLPKILEDQELPLTLPKIDKYLPTESGEPPLARAKREDWPIYKGDRMEFNTMPGWAGSSWYFLRYMDPGNNIEFADPKKIKYWGQVDLYIGGAEHGTGHLLYSRFWTKFLYDRGWIDFDEPFRKMINQGMIGGAIEYVLLKKAKTEEFAHFVCAKLAKKQGLNDLTRIPVRVDIIKAYGTTDSFLNTDGIVAFTNWNPNFKEAIFECEMGTFHKGVFTPKKDAKENHLFTLTEHGKMSKRYFNTVDPLDICNEFGADTLRLYEMFLGPLEQHKPWDTHGITGVHNFLRKLWRLCDKDKLSNEKPTLEELKILHKSIKKITEDLERHAFNTVVSALMIAVNELTELNCHKKEILEPFIILVSPYAPHISEEIWQSFGNSSSITLAKWPLLDNTYLKESEIEYPVSFNGKMRFKISLSADLSKAQIEEAVMKFEKSEKYLEGKIPKKIIVVPGKIVNVVI